MRIDFRDPNIPFSPPPPPPPPPPRQLPQTFLPQTSPFFTRKGLKTYIYSCARIRRATLGKIHGGGGGGVAEGHKRFDKWGVAIIFLLFTR